MIKFFESMPKYFLSAVKSIARHVSMSLSSASAVAVTLTLMSLFFIIAENMNGFTKNVEEDLKIHASIDNIKTQDDIKKMEEKIQAITEIKKVEYSSKEEELSILVKENGDVFQRYEDHNPMNNAFIVEVKQAKDINTVTKKLNRIDGIQKAQYGGEDIRNMVNTFASLRYGGAIFLLGLAFIAIFLISNTIKMTIYTRHTEISIMRNVGATNWYIKTPFMIEGMFIGILGASVPILITAIGYSLLYQSLGGVFLSSMFVMQKPWPFVFFICLALFVSGAIVGVIGSFHAVNKYLRWSR